jgi:response regulator RpfG family c-di-GMP phosphodiesterase
MLTGYSDIKVAMAAINRGGAYRYISKPWDDEEFICVIKDAVKRYNLIKENQRLTEIVKKQNEEMRHWNLKLARIVQEQTIEIVNKNQRLKENFDDTIIAFSKLLELRNSSIRHHSKNVCEMSVQVAKKMNLPEDEIENIRIASLLHDIGKIGLSDSLLTKDFEEMTAREVREYMFHPIRAQAVIDPIENLRNAGILIRHHHERFNGHGFPDKLMGKNIPLGSRIISVADFMDKTIGKFTGDKVVKFAMNKLKEELMRNFDPQIYNLIEEAATDVYHRTLPSPDILEQELHLEDLNPGMIISRDIVSGSGFPFLGKGTELTEKNINAIKRYSILDPSQEGIFIWTKKQEKPVQ